MARAFYSRLFLPILLGCFGQLLAQQIDMQGTVEYIPYGEWSRCTVSCGGGLSFRVKECDELTGGSECEKSESRPCNTKSCESEDTHEYIPYGEWSRCTVSCGGGLSFRVKECDELTGGIDCEKSESRPCNTNSCQSQGNVDYIPYGEWSRCTVSCGGGLSFRVKECDELTGGIDCEKSESRPCNTKSCESKDTDEYIPYGEWSRCTVSCGGGLSFRVKECDELTGGMDCEKSESRPCNTMSCETEDVGSVASILVGRTVTDSQDESNATKNKNGSGNNFDNYSAWSECTVTCGGGYSFRTRECNDFSGEIDCEKSERRRCNEKACERILAGARSLQLSFIKPDGDQTSLQPSSSTVPLDEIMEGQVGGRQIPSRENLIGDTTIATVAIFPPTTRTTTSAATTTQKAPSTTITIATATQARFRRPKTTTLPPQTTTKYETAPAQSMGMCGGTLLASKKVKTMDSKVFMKNRKYDCVWQISAPRGSTVKARIMYYHTAKCCSSMEVYDSDQLLKKYQGTIFVRGDDFTTNTTTLIVLYSNPAVNGYARVRVFYRVAALAGKKKIVDTTSAVRTTKPHSIKPTTPLSEPTKGSILLNNVRKCGHDVRATHYVLQLRSPYFIHGKQYDCTWHIIAPPGRRLQIQLYYYNTAMGGDTMEVKGGSELLDRISTNTYSQTKYITKGRTLSLRFTSQGYSGTRRFYAYYTIQPDMIPAMPVYHRGSTSPYYTSW